MDELMREIVELWNPMQLEEHIQKLEARIIDTRKLITELKLLLRKKSRRTLDNGIRGGVNK